MDCRWHRGVDFPNCLEGELDSALCDATQVCQLQRRDEKLEPCLCMLKQEMHGLEEEPSALDCEVMRDDADKALFTAESET